MKRSDLSRLETTVREANPVPEPSDLVNSEESKAVALLVTQRRRTMTTTLTPEPPRSQLRPSPTRRWAWAFAAALTVTIFVVGGIALIQRGSGAPVIDQATSTTPTTATTTTTPQQPGELSILAARTAGPVPPVAACPPGSRPDQPRLADQDRPPSSRLWTRASIDEQSGVMVMLAETARDGSRTWTFDLCSNTWQLMHPDQEPPSSPEVYAALVYDRDSDRTVAVEDSVWSYDVETNTWTHHGSPPSPARYDLSYHDPSGLVLAADLETMTLWAYDVDTNSWTAVEQGSALPPVGQPTGQSDYIFYPASQILGYDSSADLMVLYMGDNCFGKGPFDGCGTQSTWVFDPNSGRWSQQETVTPEVHNYLGGQAAFDRSSGRAVVFADGELIAYDAQAREWEVLYSSVPDSDGIARGPFNRSGIVMAFDPINQRLVMTGGTARMLSGEPYQDGMPLPTSHQDRNDVWAFDTRTGEWIVLLEQAE